MPLNKSNQRYFHRGLYAGQLRTVTILKRMDDQQEGTVRSVVIYECRRSKIYRRGEPIQGDIGVIHHTIWHIPAAQLYAAGIDWLNPADRIVDGNNRVWQPESYQTITHKLFEDHMCVDCVRIDPPNNPVVAVTTPLFV